MSLRTVACSLTRGINRTPSQLATWSAARTYATESKKKAPVHPPRRTYLHNQYESIINNDRIVFIFQHNNLTVKEFTTIRQELAQLDAPTKLTVLRSGVFNSVLRTTKYANLEPLLAGGPACVLHTNLSDQEHPGLLKKAMQVINKNKKLTLLGGKVDETLLSFADVNKVVELPGLEYVRAELLGVLESPGRKLLGTLDSPARQLHSVLDRRTE
ncbi:hypothetical protein BDB00DRAFT_847188 [Zychaea mexicana]|uniref:uncharacterized protein n=1 Tax=Zychaea mexicana TaxID=64656 RepID=UPI0022FE9432|nr:uncharacterized protein BDB00DRAFT_847188 [Zychaea mexicana]KAI9488630.1 hypothetical protein BDB00DRAFT_847188 [Zychaea mexicana]